MGEVYRATDTRLEREVAIKVLPTAFTEDKERLARFECEAQLLAQLNHTSIAQVFGLETSRLERRPGQPLAGLARRRRLTGLERRRPPLSGQSAGRGGIGQPHRRSPRLVAGANDGNPMMSSGEDARGEGELDLVVNGALPH